MIKLKKILDEDYGGPGKATYPSDHKAGMEVPKGGSMCANCGLWEAKGNLCLSKHWIDWNGGDKKIPYPADQYCCNWWEWSK